MPCLCLTLFFVRKPTLPYLRAELSNRCIKLYGPDRTECMFRMFMMPINPPDASHAGKRVPVSINGYSSSRGALSVT